MNRRETRKHSWAKVCAWVALLVAVAGFALSLVVWVSYGTSEWEVGVSRGAVAFVPESYFSGESVVPGWSIGELRSRSPMRWLPRRHQGGGGGYLYIVPLWIPVIAAAGVVVWLTVRERQITSPSACATCGYDCTGVPEAGVCPECGKARAEEARS